MGEEVTVDDDIEELRKEVEQSVNLSEKLEQSKSVAEYILNCRPETENIPDDCIEDIDAQDNLRPHVEEDEGKVKIEEEKDDIVNLSDFNSQFKPFRDNLVGNTDDETRSVRSVSTTASTIHPDVVKARVKAALEKSKKKNQARRTIAKGEASAKTRSKRENKNIINTSRSAFWADN